jgi:hypothetical protein
MVYCLLLRKLQIQFCWVCIVVNYLMLCWLMCFDQVLCLLDVCVEYRVILLLEIVFPIIFCSFTFIR